MKDSSQIVIDKTALWLSSMDQYFDAYPDAVNVFVSFIQNDQERLDLAIIGINKTNNGYGFDIETENGSWNDYAMVDVNGKWVMVLREDPEPDNMESDFIPYASDRTKAVVANGFTCNFDEHASHSN